MPLAAPLILPFAELAGITIAGLGMAATSQKVGDFISDNPELSKQILTTLLPGGVGLNTLFKKEAGITLEDVEEMTDEEAADLSKEDKAEIMKEVGKSKGGDKRQRMIEISEKLGLSGKGKEEQDFVDEVEERYEGTVREKKAPFDYKKFFRNRNADGGAIGIEVLFEEKKDGGRIGYQSGGGILGNVQNIINKEFLDMTYPDKYYTNVIEPAKAGKAPMPSKMEMFRKSQPIRAVFDIGTNPAKYGEFRSAPTKLADQFIKGVGTAAKFGLNRVAPVFSIFAPTELGSAELTEEDRMSMNIMNQGEGGGGGGGGGQRVVNPELLNQFDNITNTGVNQRPTLGNRIKTGIETVGNKLGSVGDYIKGGGIIGQVLQNLGNAFEYRGGMGYVDEDGVFRSAEELDKQNARGGYYTDIARASRRRDKSIRNMLARQAAGKRIGENRLAALQEQQAKEEAARQAAFNEIMSQANNQQSFYDSLNQGQGSTAVSGNPTTSGAGDMAGYSGPSTFAKGGIATMFVEKR